MSADSSVAEEPSHLHLEKIAEQLLDSTLLLRQDKKNAEAEQLEEQIAQILVYRDRLDKFTQQETTPKNKNINVKKSPSLTTINSYFQKKEQDASKNDSTATVSSQHQITKDNVITLCQQNTKEYKNKFDDNIQTLYHSIEEYSDQPLALEFLVNRLNTWLEERESKQDFPKKSWIMQQAPLIRTLINKIENQYEIPPSIINWAFSILRTTSKVNQKSKIKNSKIKNSKSIDCFISDIKEKNPTEFKSQTSNWKNIYFGFICKKLKENPLKNSNDLALSSSIGNILSSLLLHSEEDVFYMDLYLFFSENRAAFKNSKNHLYQYLPYKLGVLIALFLQDVNQLDKQIPKQVPNDDNIFYETYHSHLRKELLSANKNKSFKIPFLNVIFNTQKTAISIVASITQDVVSIYSRKTQFFHKKPTKRDESNSQRSPKKITKKKQKTLYSYANKKLQYVKNSWRQFKKDVKQYFSSSIERTKDFLSLLTSNPWHALVGKPTEVYLVDTKKDENGYNKTYRLTSTQIKKMNKREKKKITEQKNEKNSDRSSPHRRRSKTYANYSSYEPNFNYFDFLDVAKEDDLTEEENDSKSFTQQQKF